MNSEEQRALVWEALEVRDFEDARALAASVDWLRVAVDFACDLAELEETSPDGHRESERLLARWEETRQAIERAVRPLAPAEAAAVWGYVADVAAWSNELELAAAAARSANRLQPDTLTEIFPDGFLPLTSTRADWEDDPPRLRDLLG
jgi:hypothetical protein